MQVCVQGVWSLCGEEGAEAHCRVGDGSCEFEAHGYWRTVAVMPSVLRCMTMKLIYARESQRQNAKGTPAPPVASAAEAQAKAAQEKAAQEKAAWEKKRVEALLKDSEQDAQRVGKAMDFSFVFFFPWFAFLAHLSFS